MIFMDFFFLMNLFKKLNYVVYQTFYFKIYNEVKLQIYV